MLILLILDFSTAELKGPSGIFFRKFEAGVCGAELERPGGQCSSASIAVQAASTVGNRFHVIPWVEYYAAAYRIPQWEVRDFQAAARLDVPGPRATLRTPEPGARPKPIGDRPPPSPQLLPGPASRSGRDPPPLGAAHTLWPLVLYPPPPQTSPTAPQPDAPPTPWPLISPPTDLVRFAQPPRPPRRSSYGGGGPAEAQPRDRRGSYTPGDAGPPPPGRRAPPEAVPMWKDGVLETTRHKRYLYAAWVFVVRHNAGAPGDRKGLDFGRQWAKFYATSGAHSVAPEEFEAAWARAVADPAAAAFLRDPLGPFPPHLRGARGRPTGGTPVSPHSTLTMDTAEFVPPPLPVDLGRQAQEASRQLRSVLHADSFSGAASRLPSPHRPVPWLDAADPAIPRNPLGPSPLHPRGARGRTATGTPISPQSALTMDTAEFVPPPLPVDPGWQAQEASRRRRSVLHTEGVPDAALRLPSPPRDMADPAMPEPAPRRPSRDQAPNPLAGGPSACTFCLFVLCVLVCCPVG